MGWGCVYALTAAFESNSVSRLLSDFAFAYVHGVGFTATPMPSGCPDN